MASEREREEELEKAKSESPEKGETGEGLAVESPAKQGGALVRSEGESLIARDADDARDSNMERGAGTATAPLQLGYMRYVYGAYMGGAMLVAFLTAKIGHTAWYRLGQWKPEFGEPKDEYVYPAAGVIGILVTVYYWRKLSARQYATEVAEELSKVSWPSRKEVQNSTTVVIMTTIFATIFFALMDQFWKYVTDRIYSFNGSF